MSCVVLEVTKLVDPDSRMVCVLQGQPMDVETSVLTLPGWVKVVVMVVAGTVLVTVEPGIVEQVSVG